MTLFEERFVGVWTPLYLQKLLYKWAVVFLLLGAFQFIVIAFFQINLLTAVFGEGFFTNLIYVLIASSALYLMLQRDTYLPFLGATHVPCSVLQPREPPGATKSVQVSVPPHAKVLYWASEPSVDSNASLESWKKAYTNYENAGVAIADASGTAVLRVRNPQPYKVPFKGRLESHVHYRVCGEPGWMESVQTVMISDEPEAFETDSEPYEEMD